MSAVPVLLAIMILLAAALLLSAKSPGATLAAVAVAAVLLVPPDLRATAITWVHGSGAGVLLLVLSQPLLVVFGRQLGRALPPLNKKGAPS